MFQVEVPDFMTYKAGGEPKTPSTELAVLVLGGVSLSSVGGDGGSARRPDTGEARKARKAGDSGSGGSVGGGGGGRVRLEEQQISKCPIEPWESIVRRRQREYLQTGGWGP
jgi:hypothetical protein